MNVSDGLRISAWKFPNKDAAVYFDQRLSYKEMDQRVTRLANGLLEMGFRKGDKIAFLLYNCIEGLEIIQAGLRAGLVIVPINYRLSEDQMEYVINHCDAQALFLGDQFVDTIKPMMPNLKNIPPKNYFIIGERKEDMTFYEDILSENDQNPDADVKLHDIACIVYTSGTTGLPKGCLLSSRALMQNMANAMYRGYARKGVTPEDRRLLLLMPVVHSNSIWSSSITYWYGGTNVVYKSRGFDPEEVLKIMHEERITTSSVVPYFLTRILELPQEVLDKYDLSSVTSLGSGSAMLYPSVIDKLLHYFQNVRISNSYGSTETGPATTLRFKELDKKPSSIGKSIPGVEVKVFDDEGNELGPNQVGNLWVKSDICFDGYHKAPEKTAKSKVGNWVCAGDLGYYDEEGYFYLADRSDDVIVSAGEHIASTEVENVIMKHPKVAEVGVIGTPDEKYGQRVTAIIRLEEGEEATEDEIREFCREQGLPGYKLPRRVDFVSELPKTLTGKVLKRILRAQYK